MESACLKYINRHDYLLVLKIPLEVIFSQNQTSLSEYFDVMKNNNSNISQIVSLILNNAANVVIKTYR